MSFYVPLPLVLSFEKNWLINVLSIPDADALSKSKPLFNTYSHGVSYAHKYFFVLARNVKEKWLKKVFLYSSALCSLQLSSLT
jgi:predicted membrane-bound mannosyltransferase